MIDSERTNCSKCLWNHLCGTTAYGKILRSGLKTGVWQFYILAFRIDGSQFVPADVALFACQNGLTEVMQAASKPRSIMMNSVCPSQSTVCGLSGVNVPIWPLCKWIKAKKQGVR